MQSDQQLAATVAAMLQTSRIVRECFAVEQIREALTESFDSWAEARTEDPEDGQRPLWDMRMDDSDWDHAAFVVWIWDMEVVWLACGTGNSYRVRHFCGQRAACECDDLFPALQKQFHMPVPPISLLIGDIEHWINRTWN